MFPGIYPDSASGPVLSRLCAPSVSAMSTISSQSSAAGFPESRPTASRSPAVGLPLVVVVGLALLAVPRVILHDLDLVHEGTFVNLLLVLVPLIVWLAVVLRARVGRPFTTLLAVGGVYGVLLAVTHQLLWNMGLDGGDLQLGGNLAGLSPGAQEGVFRVAGVFSSLFTGLVVGAVTGTVALTISAAAARAGRGSNTPPTV